MAQTRSLVRRGVGRLVAEGGGECVAGFVGAEDAGGVLVVQPVAGGGQAGGGGADGVHEAGVGDGGEVFAGDADGEVGGTGAVEVGDGEGGPEAVTGLTGLGDPGGVLDQRRDPAAATPVGVA